MNNSGEKEKKSKKKKKHKHNDSDADSTKSKHKKSKKAKKLKQEPGSDVDSKDKLKKAIKKEKKESAEKPIKREVVERRKLSIVIKDLRSSIIKPLSSKSSSSKDKEKEREKEKRRKSKEREKDQQKRDRKSNGNVSDVSLSDEETYRKMLEYHTSSQWHERNNHIREWDRDKYRRGRSRDDDRKLVFISLVTDSDSLFNLIFSAPDITDIGRDHARDQDIRQSTKRNFLKSLARTLFQFFAVARYHVLSARTPKKNLWQK